MFNENTAGLRALGASLTGSIFARRTAAAPGGLPALERAAIDASTIPARVVTIEATGVSAVVLQLAQNGNVTVFATGDGLQFALRDGVLVSTRGLGVDLMSAAAPTAATLRRADGTHARSYFTLTGTDATRRLDLTCTLAPEGRATLAIYGLSVPTEVVVERCAGAGLGFENRYWFDAGGRIRQSRQWVNDAVGTIGLLDPMR